MAQTGVLSSEEVRVMRAELAEGKTPTVWFTQAAVGVTQGRSGKVVSLGELDEGDFIQVKPAGSQDVLSFSAGEVTTSRPPRQRKAPAGEAKTPSPSRSSKKPGKAADASPSVSSPDSGAGASNGRATSKTSSGKSAGDHKEPARSPSSGAAGGASSQPRRRTGQQPGVVITLTSSPSGQWTVDVTTGKKRVLKEAPVSASAVAHAAEALHEDVAGAVEPLFEAAREQQRARVEQLQQELVEAERALADLTDQPSRGR